MLKQKKLEKLNKEIKNCKKCPLWKTRKNAVPGEGLVNAKIMICGQAPGSEEDKVGRPFIGRAGKFLNQLLKTAGIKREKIYLTSPIKCFPPKNRKPTKKEIEACLPWLIKQIEIIRPKKIILLGEVVFSVFFQKKELSSFRGSWIKKAGKEYFISYHPAAGLRFPRIKKILEKDFKKIRKIISS
ncbi:MAG: uracil-DNA glycosylase [Candidatus Nealsonbacteria bacterium]|nr:MAG: uracil-DNA glycosylase [Candidatus Nealsonbacteria bacterium]